MTLLFAIQKLKKLECADSRFKCEDGDAGGQYSKRVKKEVVSGSEWRSDSNNNSDNNPTYYGLDHLHLHQHNV